MTANVPWSVKGIDRKARETAKDLARRSGMTLGEWLNQVIEYQGEGQITPLPQTNNLTEAVEKLTARIEAVETRSTLAVTGIDQSVRGLAARLEATDRERDETSAQLVERLNRLESSAAPESSAALKALEGTVNQITGQVLSNDAAQKEILAQIRDELGGLATRLNALDAGGAEAVLGDAERRLEALAASVTSRIEAVRQITGETPRSAETRLSNMEGALLRVQQHVREAEERSTGAIERMGHEVLRMADTLGRQVKGVEARAADAIDRLGGDVARLTEQLDVRLREADHAQAKALEKLGDEIARIAERLSDRIGASERRTAQSLDQFAGPAASEAMEAKFEDAGELADRIRHSEERTARLLEEGRARIEERLGQRPVFGSAAEDDILAQVADIESTLTPAAEDEVEAPAADPVVAQVETEAEDAFDAMDFSPAAFAPRERSYASFNEAPAPVIYPDEAAQDVFAPQSFTAVEPNQTRVAFEEPSFAAADDTGAAFDISFEKSDLASDPFASVELEPREVDEDPFALTDEDATATAASFSVVEEEAADAEPAAATDEVEAFDPFASLNFEPATPFESAPIAADDPFDADDEFETASEVDAPESFVAEAGETENEAEGVEAESFDAEGHEFTPGPFARRDDPAEDLLEHEAPSSIFADEERDEFVAADPAAEAMTSRMEFIERARAAARSAAHDRGDESARFGFGGRRAKSRSKNGLLMSTAVLVCLGSGLVGATILAPKLKQGAEDGKSVSPQPRAAMLTTPKPIGPEARAPASAAVTPIIPGPNALTPPPGEGVAPQTGIDTAAIYAEAVRLLDQKDPKAVEPLRRAANLGHPQAQLQLGRLYETGQMGVPRDLAEARRWTQRAADAGVAKAMHNLAMYYFNGEGGERSTAIAAQWFRQASEKGLADSQYNLGLLYERGIGVVQNPAEAYKWFLIASRGGDTLSRAEARQAALRVRPLLSGEAQAAAERTAAAQISQPTQQADARTYR